MPTAVRPAPAVVVPFREVRHYGPDDSLHFEALGLRGSEYQWTIPAHRHEDLHQFQLLTAGAMNCVLDGERHALQAPAALMVAPGVVHTFRYAPDSAGLQVTVPAELLQGLVASSAPLASRLRIALVLDAAALGEGVSECILHFQRLGEEFAARHASRNEALRAHAMLLALWFLRHPHAGGTAGRRDALRDTLVQRFRALVEQHYTEHRPLGFYAQALEVTPDHLSRVCRAVTSSGALTLLQERLVLEARRLLMLSGATSAEIAERLGFADASYFSRFFSAMTGSSPSAFRAALADGTAALPAATADAAAPTARWRSAGT